MVLHFKTSTDGQLWFLYCSSLRLIEENKQIGRGVPLAGVDKAMQKRILSVSENRPNTAHHQVNRPAQEDEQKRSEQTTPPQHTTRGTEKS